MMSMVGNFASAADWSMAAGVLSLTLLVGITIGWALLRRLPRSGRFGGSGILLEDATHRETGYISAASRADLIGAQGVTLTAVRPSGTARFGEERVDVVSDSSWIEAGTPVRIVRAEGYRHVVEPAE